MALVRVLDHLVGGVLLGAYHALQGVTPVFRLGDFTAGGSEGLGRETWKVGFG